MAKMFYSLEEAAMKLGMSQDELKELSVTGQLQQFRDRDKVMFKRQQIDDLAQEQETDLDESLRTDVDGLLAEPLDATIPLADDDEATTDSQGLGSTDTNMIDLITSPQLEPLEMPEPDRTPIDSIDAAAESDADISSPISDLADEMSDLSGITQIADSTVDLDENDDLSTDPLDDEADDDELVLEQIGSGSGLLDLARESDDTSLGTELLDEIYPDPALSHKEPVVANSDTSGTLDTMEEIDAAITSSSIFDGSGELDISNSGLENLQDAGEPSSVMPPSMAMPTGESIEALVFDYPGNGLGVGMLMVAIGCLLLALTVVIYAVMGVPSSTTGSLAMHLPGYCGGLFAMGIVLGLVGMFLGKAQKR